MSEREPAALAALAADLGDGSSARAVGYAAEQLTLVVDRPYPPGRPLSFTLALAGSTLALEGKCQGSKRRDDGAFDVRVRLTSLRKEQRALLEQALGGAPP